MMLACLAIGSGTALGCDVEPSSDLDAGSETANQAQASAQIGPPSTIYGYPRDKEFIKMAKPSDRAAQDKVVDALRTCIDKHLNITECFGLLDPLYRPRPGCLMCEGTSPATPPAFRRD
jgi:hypothetical protein